MKYFTKVPFHIYFFPSFQFFQFYYLGDGSYILIEAPRLQGGASHHCIISFILCPRGFRGTFRPITKLETNYFIGLAIFVLSQGQTLCFHCQAFLDENEEIPLSPPCGFLIGIYKFYENGSTETFGRKDLKRRIVCWRLQVNSKSIVFPGGSPRD